MSRYIRHLIAALTLLIVSAAVSANPALAATKAITTNDAVALLRTYSIVRGEPSGDMRLNDRLTRAQAATIFVRVLGKGDVAYFLANDVPFTDATGHWAAGEIAMSDRLGLMRGDGDGMFRPDADITYAEVLTVLLRILEQEPGGLWSPDTIRHVGDGLGLVPQGVSITEPALRGKVFWSLATAIANVPLSTGNTILQTYFDNTAPELKLDRTAFTTTDETATIAGTVTGASTITANGTPVVPDQSGRFTYKANLALGDNTVQIEAVDVAGNRTAGSVAVKREVAYARIEVNGPSMLKAGASSKLDINVYDAKGNVVSPTGLKAEMTGGAGVFDAQSSTLVAGNNAGQGVLTLSIGAVRKTFAFSVTKPSDQAVALSISSVSNGATVTTGKEFTVTVGVVDAAGQTLPNDYWRTVTLTSTGAAGVLITTPTVTTVAGVATFKVTGVTAGDIALTASSSGMAPYTTYVKVVTPIRVVLTPLVNQLVPDGVKTTAIRATLQDETGKPVLNNSGQDIRITLWGSGPYGQVTDASLTISRGQSTSAGDDGAFRAGYANGTASLQASLTSSQGYSVMPPSVAVTGKLRAVKLQLVAPSSVQTVGSNQSTRVTVKAVDSQGQLVPEGAYAFQISVTSSNPGTSTGALPDGVELKFANSFYYPVDDGRSASDPQNDPYSVVGRTYQGQASLDLRNNRSGVITLTLKPVEGTDNAYFPNAPDFGPASSTVGFEATTAQVTFAAAPAGIKLTVTSGLGQNVGFGAVGTSPTTVTVRAQLVDAFGTVIPGYTGNQLKLTRVTDVSNISSIVGATSGTLTKSLTTSGAEWSIRTTGATGTARYQVSSATTGFMTNVSAELTVAGRNIPAVPPTIVAIRGTKDGDPSPGVGVLEPDDDYMEIQLARQLPPGTESNYTVLAKVYRVGETDPVFTKLINLNQDVPTIQVPKANLRLGTATYQVSIHNGVQESGRSADPGFGLSTVTYKGYDSIYKITGAHFDYETGRLVLYTSGLSTNDVLDLGKISIVKGDNSVILNTFGLSGVVNSSSAVVLDTRGALSIALDPLKYHGEVTVKADADWFKSADGSHLAAPSSTVLLKPMAWISQATLDTVNRTLYIYGEGLSQGNISLNRILIGDVALGTGYYTDNDSVTSRSDKQIIISLSRTTVDRLPKGVVSLKTTPGWLSESYGGYTNQAARLTSVSVYVRVLVFSASYDKANHRLIVQGSGFNSGRVDLQKLSFHVAGSTGDYTLNSSSTASVDSDGALTITLGPEDITAFSNTDQFAGKQVFLNASAGWMTLTASQRQAAPTPVDSVLFTVPTP